MPAPHQIVGETSCDLHLHSSASQTEAEWYGRYFRCPESYVEPLAQYDLCKARGMTLVTLTDHDTIAGGIRLLDKPDFFLSEEVTVRFPENGCVMHVLVWNINPDQHGFIQERRSDVYALTDYLQREEIAYGLAHPLFSPNGKLDRDTFEKALLLFPTFETINGLLDVRVADELVQILSGLDAVTIKRLALKHGRPANGTRPHVKAETAGSDDHANRRSGTVFTSLSGDGVGVEAFLAGVLAGRGRIVGRSADLNTMSACSQKTTSDFLRRRDGGAPARGGDPVSDLIETVLGRRPDGPLFNFLAPVLARSSTSGRGPAVAVAGEGAPDLLALGPPLATEALDHEDATMVRAVAELFDANCGKALDALAPAMVTFDPYRMIDSLRDFACAAAAAAPYLFAADHFGKQLAQARTVRRDWTATKLPPTRKRLAVFSDSLEQVDGVSTWCERFVGEAVSVGCDVLVPYCGDVAKHPDGKRFHSLPAIRSFPVPFYSQIRLYVPSLVSTVDWMWRSGVSNVELSTPGPMGLVGLLAAKLLRLPVTASYHTEIPSLVSALGGDSMLDTISRGFMAWFYNRADVAFVYSDKARARLVELGVEDGRIEVLPITVNPDHFSPRLGSPSIFRELGIDLDGRAPILSVGRLSQEKNLPMIVEAVRRLQDEPSRPMLVIVGEGPDEAILKARFGDQPYVRFVGLQRGERLRRLYASARAFVFASCVDTLGLVNLEAMASGVPVLLPAGAGVADIVTDGVSAALYHFEASGLAEAIRRVLVDAEYASQLGTNARLAMVDRWSSHPFSRVWESFTRAS